MIKNKMISPLEQDQLVEIVNIGAGHAATAFSQMLEKKVDMDVPQAHIGNLEEVQRLFGDKEDLVLAVFLKMSGDVSGALAIIFSPDSALQFIHILTNQKKIDIRSISEDDKSALQEVGNILLGASINSLSKFLNLEVEHSIPDVAVDMLGAIMDSALIEVGAEEEKVLSFKVNLKIDKSEINGDLYYLFDPKSSNRILEATRAILEK